MKKHIFQTEEDVKIKIILPYLNSIGFDISELSFEKSFTIPGGKGFFRVDTEEQIKAVHPRLDILATRRGQNLFVIEVKKHDLEITADDITQGVTYARLLHPIAPFCIVTNGRDTKIINSITKEHVPPDFLNDSERYQVSLPDDLYYEAAKNFLGYSKQNLLAFCDWQVNTYMRPLKGSRIDTNKKYIEELYEPPVDIQTDFQSFLLSSSNCLLIISDSGMGKTCWMCHSAVESVRKGIPTLFYRAIDVEQGILTAIAEDLNWNLSPEHSESKAAKLFFDIFTNDGVLVFIDGLDEIEVGKARQVVDSFLRKISGKNIKLITTSKTTSWENIKQSDGIPTHFADVSSHFNNQVGYFLGQPSDRQFTKMIEKYRHFFKFNGSFENKVIQDCKRSPFLMRIMFEVASSKGLSHLTYTAREFYEEYFKRVVERFDTQREVAEQILIQIAGVLYNHKEEIIGIDELRKELKLSLLEQLPSRLFDLNVLVRQEVNGYVKLGFYFNKVRDFLIAFRYLKWQELSDEDFALESRKDGLGGIQNDVLNLYYALANESHKRVLDKSVYDNALKYISLYEALLSEHFSAFLWAFSPHQKLPSPTATPIGFWGILDLQKKSIVYFGFREITPNQQKVMLLPASEMQGDKGENQRISLAMIGGASSLHNRTSLNGFKTLDMNKEIVENEILPELNKITEQGMLDESQNAELLLEKLLAIAARHYREYLGIRNPFSLDPYLPLSFDKIYEALLYERALKVLHEEWRERKIADGSIIETWNNGIVSCSYEVSKQESEQVKADATKAAISGEYLERPNTRYINEEKIESFITHSIKSLRMLGYDKITSATLVEWDNPNPPSESYGSYWKPNTLKLLLKKVYTSFLNEYQILVARNFPTICTDFELYKEMPVKLFMLLTDTLEPSGWICECKSINENLNTVEVCTPNEVVIDKTEETLSYEGTQFSILSKAWTHPLTLLNPINPRGNNYSPYETDSHHSVLRNLVYAQVRSDLKGAFIKFAKNYGVEVKETFNLFPR